jgi:hypothetical protein
MTVLDVLMSRVDAFLYVGAIIAGIGFLVGVVATMVLTATVRGHGYFHVMLEQEAARANETLSQVEDSRSLARETRKADAVTDDLIRRWDDQYYAGFAEDDEDDEPEIYSWRGNDPWVTVVDAVAADENFVEIGIGENYVIPAEAATAVDDDPFPLPTLSFWSDEPLTDEEVAGLKGWFERRSPK